MPTQGEKKIEKGTFRYNTSPTNVLLVFLSFWITVLLTRGAIFFMVRHGSIPALFIRGLHVHHFITGFILLIFSVFLVFKKIYYKHIPLVLFGCGVALISDEFLFWTRGHFEYWDIINLIAVALIGILLAALYQYTRQQHRALPQTLGKDLQQWALVILPVVLAVLLMLNWYSYNNALAARAESRIFQIQEHKAFIYPAPKK